MASVVSWRPLSRRASAVSQSRAEPALAWHGHLLGVLAFSLPFLGLSLLAQQELFLSQQHARIVARALTAIDRNHLEWVVSTYPPSAFLLALLKPSALTLSLAAALLAGGTTWVLWNDLLKAPLTFVTRLALLVALVVTPASTFLATQAVNHAATLFLFVLAWHGMHDLVQKGRIWGGFVAGMLLGLAFYAGLCALACGLLCALATPWAALTTEATSPKERRKALLTRMVVIAFPVLMALVSWAYMNLIFSGDPWRFLRDPTSASLAYLNPDALPMTGLVAALRGTGHELLRLPLYLLVGLIVALKARKWLPLYLVPLVSVILLRALGFHYPEALALSACTAMALAALSQWRSRRWGLLLAMVALLQVAMSIALPCRDGDLTRWHALLGRGGPLVADELEVAVAAHFRQATPHSILADDSAAYRLIARAGTARPFLLPVDATFELAANAPAHYAKYILMATSEANSPACFGDIPLAEFTLEATWPGWRLYRSVAAPPLLISAALYPHGTHSESAETRSRDLSP